MVIGIDCSRAFVSERTGTENYAYYLLCEMLRRDTKHYFRLYLRPNSTDIRSFESHVHSLLPDTQNFELVTIRATRLWTQLGLAIELWHRHVDVLFVPAHTLPLLRPSGIKTVVTIHDLGYEYLSQYHQFPHKLWLTYFTEYAAHEAHKVIAVSGATKEDLIAKFQVEPSRIEVVYEGFVPRVRETTDVERDNVMRKYFLDQPYFVFVGTVQPRKNLERAIQAFALLRTEEQFKNLQFVIIGKKGWLSDEIYAAPAKYGVQHAVKFLGYVPDADVQIIWKHAQATFFATLFEGFGIPILDSQSLGVPVITSNKKPFTEVGDTACVFVDPDKASDIAEGMRLCLTDQVLRKRLIADGYENCKRFSWQHAADETLRVIESV